MALGTIFFILGCLLSGFGVSMLLPALVSFLNHGGDYVVFIESAATSIFVGVVLVLMNNTTKRQLTHRDGFLLTFLTWFSLSLVGALPIYFSGVAPNFVDALFEAVSGLTTTGATVLSGLDSMEPGILLWRCMLQWFGGMGLIVLAVAVLPFLGIGGMQLYKSEMPGVVKDKLQPRMQDTAKTLWLVYIIFTVICAWAYNMAGMSMFDAVCHAFTTLSTGGFSTHDASFSYFNSPRIEVISMIFMLIGAMNFSLHFLALSRRSIDAYLKDSELQLFLMIIVGCTFIVVAALVGANYYETVGEAFRLGLFNTISILTTTGFANADYNLWPASILLLFLFVMFIGGCTGSASGGIKVLRTLMILKQANRELKRLVHPRSIVHLKIQNRTVPEDVLQTVWSFVGVYTFVFIVFALSMGFMGKDFLTSISAAAATITSVGPGFGEVGPAGNYASFPQLAKLMLCLNMLLGRLEIFTLLVIMTPAFWRK